MYLSRSTYYKYRCLYSVSEWQVFSRCLAMARFPGLLLLLLLLHSILAIESRVISKQPNIIYLLMDDLGYNDIGYHDPTIDSPVLVKLASQGIILENHYTAPMCGPSRAALLTGRYNFHLGLQHWIIAHTAPACLPKGNPILPEALKVLGYNTYMLGKWGMGFCNVNCTPTYRGFDKFYGYYGSEIGHYNHESTEGFYDFHDDLVPETCSYGKYSTEILSARAGEYIDNHVQNVTTRGNPLFMYFAFQTVHTPLEAPLEYLERHNDEPNQTRRVIKAMVSLTDDVIGRLVQKLKDVGLYDNSIIIFSSDNGGDAYHSSNHPLRGAKLSIWEGGVRVPTFVHSPLLRGSARTVSYELVHQTDWFPTIISLAGGTVPEFVYGYDQSNLILNGGVSERSVVPIHYDPTDPPVMGRAAIRSGKWKLIKGFAGKWDGYDALYAWYPNVLYVVDAEAGAALPAAQYENSTLLFDLEADPRETTDLAADYPEVVKHLESLLQGFADSAVDTDPALYQKDPLSDPRLYGYTWSYGWC